MNPTRDYWAVCDENYRILWDCYKGLLVFKTKRSAVYNAKKFDRIPTIVAKFHVVLPEPAKETGR